VRLPEHQGCAPGARCIPGDGFYIPQGEPHQYYNVSDTPVSLLFGVGTGVRRPGRSASQQPKALKRLSLSLAQLLWRAIYVQLPENHRPIDCGPLLLHTRLWQRLDARNRQTFLPGSGFICRNSPNAEW